MSSELPSSSTSSVLRSTPLVPVSPPLLGSLVGVEDGAGCPGVLGPCLAGLALVDDGAGESSYSSSGTLIVPTELISSF